MSTYSVFHRTWWQHDTSGEWPDNRRPGVGPRTYIAHGLDYSSARAMARRWNEEHDPGPLSRKAEFEEVSS